MSYFDVSNEELTLGLITKPEVTNTARVVEGSLDFLRFSVGDIVGIGFRFGAYNYFFEGICISIFGKRIVLPDTAFVLRNVLSSVSVELIISYFYNRLFSVRLSFFKRKQDSYIQSKIYYVRNKLNKHSRII